MPLVTVSFELCDGRVLECRYGYKVTPGRLSGPPEFCYPDETEIGDPAYFLDGKEVSLSELPKGLDAIANRMHEYEPSKGDTRFGYSEETPEPDYDEPDDWDWDG